MLITGAVCDKCNVAVKCEGVHTKKVLIASLRSKGWQIGKKTICPTCKPQPKKIEL